MFKIPFTSWYVGKQMVAPLATNTSPLVEMQIPLPTKGGRVSEPDGVTLLDALVTEAQEVKPDFEIRLLDAIEHLAKYNADLSFAVKNIVDLGGGEPIFTFDDKVSDEQAKEMITYIKTHFKSVYSGGIMSLINDLISQIMVTGAISAENIPAKDLRSLEQVVLVAPKSIRFFYNKEKGRYMPYQQQNNSLIDTLRQQAGVPANMVELNTVTYKYYAIQRYNEKPYAIPPFLSALEAICIERDMMTNLKSIIRRVGLFGFLHVMVTVPQKTAMQTDAQYLALVQNYLEAANNEVQHSLNSGYVIGVAGTHEFKLEGQANNVQGAKDIVDLVTQIKMAGMKQDPLMLGRDFNASEALGRVIIDKLVAQVGNVQRLVCEFIGDSALLALKLAGYKLNRVDALLEKPQVKDALAEEQAQTAKIANNSKLKLDGIITQQQYAQNMGYDEPALETAEPLPSPPLDPNKIPQPVVGATNPAKTKAKNAFEFGLEIEDLYSFEVQDLIEAFENELRGDSEAFDYGHVHTLNGGVENFDKYYREVYANGKYTKLLGEFLDKYYKASSAVFLLAVKKSSARITKLLAGLPNTANPQQVMDKVIATLYANWQKDYQNPQKAVSAKWIRDAYKEFKKDKTIFNGAIEIAGKKIQDAKFGIADLRTLNYFKDSDNIYLGRFITDEDTKKKVLAFIKEQYLDKGQTLSTKAITEAFANKFTNLLVGEEWKIARIVNTTVVNLKDFAALSYMAEAEVVNFKRVEVIDQLTCGYCQNLNGRVFSVSLATEQMERFSVSDPSSIKAEKPFITSVYKKPEDMANLSSEDLQRAGVVIGAVHPTCRGVSVADI